MKRTLIISALASVALLVVVPGIVLGQQQNPLFATKEFVENAIQHNVESGSLEIATAAEGQQAVLRVSNSGEQIAEQDIEALFGRFRRLDRSRSRSDENGGGYGLGLALVRATAEAHAPTATGRNSRTTCSPG